MPKLIIPNAYELYKIHHKPLTHKEAVSRLFYNFRFLWLLEPGDVILLQDLPSKEFINYLADIKGFDPETFIILSWNNALNAAFTNSLNNEELIDRLKIIISSPLDWSIQTCYFNHDILKLADRLNIPVNPSWRKLVDKDFIRHLNDKAEFRAIANHDDLPIPQGKICSSSDIFYEMANNLLKTTGSLIIKQKLNGGGRGNIAITMQKDVIIQGAEQRITWDKNKPLKELTNEIWNKATDKLNNELIIEVYYPDTKTLTVVYFIPPSGSNPVLLNYSEIRMEKTWIGVTIPAPGLAPNEINRLISTANEFANIIQQNGYEGYLCCDAIYTKNQQIFFTELNVRPGAETNAHILASHLYGHDYFKKLTVLTKKDIKVISFSKTYQLLKQENLLLSKCNKYGVAILTVEDQYAYLAEYLIAAPDLVSALAIEERLTKLLSNDKISIKHTKR